MGGLLSLSERQSRNEQTIKKLEGVDRLRPAQRERMQRILGEKGLIDSIRSTDDQIQRYGREQWERDYIRLADINERDDTIMDAERLKRLVWSKLPNSKFKRFQEAFCDQEDFVVPPFRVQNKQIIFDGNPDLDSVKGCLASAEMLPDKLMTDLKLADFAGDKRKPLNRLKKKHGKIDALKKLWESAVPLTEYSSRQKNLRVLIVRAPDARVDHEYPDIENPDPSVHGSILYSREDALPNDIEDIRKYGPLPRKITVSYFGNVYKAYRKTHEQEEEYAEGETAQLSPLQNAIQDLNEQFRHWTSKADIQLVEQLESRAQKVVAMCQRYLAKSRNQYKARVRDLMNEVVEKVEQKRSGPAMSKMTGSTNAISSRMREVSHKGGYNQRDRTELQHLYRRNEGMFKTARDSIKDKAEKLKLPLGAYKKKDRPDRRDETTVTSLLSNFRLPQYAADISVRPFTFYADAFNQQAAEIEDALRDGNKEGVVKNVILLHVIGKLQAMHVCIERLKTMIMFPERISIPAIKEYMKQINGIFQAREIFPQEVLEPYDDIYIEMQERIAALNQRIEAFDNPTLSELVDFSVEFEADLDSFDIEETTRTLLKAEYRENLPRKPR